MLSVLKMMEHMVESCENPALTAEQYEKNKAEIYNNIPGKLNEFDGYDCPICKNKGFRKEAYYNTVGGYWDTVDRICECHRKREAIQRLEKAGLKDVVKKYTFSTYETPDSLTAQIKKAAISFCKDGSRKLFFIGGQPGAGKTHICAAIAVEHIRKGRDVIYARWCDMSQTLKALANEPQYEEKINGYRSCSVLYIDDLFKGAKDTPPTPADVKLAFGIIDYRNTSDGLITILSSEKSLSELRMIDEGLAGRIRSAASDGVYCLNIARDPQRDWRFKNNSIGGL